MRSSVFYVFVFLCFILKGNTALDQEEIRSITRATSNACLQDSQYMDTYLEGQPVANIINYLSTPQQDVSQEDSDLIRNSQQVIRNIIHYGIDYEYRVYSRTDPLQWEVEPSVCFPNPVLIFPPWEKIQYSIFSQLSCQPSKRPPLEHLFALAHIRCIPEWVPICEKLFHYWESIKGLEELTI